MQYLCKHRMTCPTNRQLLVLRKEIEDKQKQTKKQTKKTKQNE